VPDYYAEYDRIIDDYISEYGKGSQQRTPQGEDVINTMQGVCVVRLIDFDKDGLDELLLCYAERQETYPTYHYAVWTSRDGKSVEQMCDSAIFSGAQYYCPYITLVEDSDCASIFEETDYGAYAVQRLDAGYWYTDISFEVVEDLPDCYYRIDRANVSEDVFYDDLTAAQNGSVSTEQIEFSCYDVSGDWDEITDCLDQTEYFIRKVKNDPDFYMSHATKLESDKNSYDEVILAYAAEYGSATIYPSIKYGGSELACLGGLFATRELDMNHDGVDELILFYTFPQEQFPSSTYYRFGISAWTMSDGSAKWLGSGQMAEGRYPVFILADTGSYGYVAWDIDDITNVSLSYGSQEFITQFYGYGDDDKHLGLYEKDMSLDDYDMSYVEYIYPSESTSTHGGIENWKQVADALVSETNAKIAQAKG
jgi:hypothetical protein